MFLKKHLFGKIRKGAFLYQLYYLVKAHSGEIKV
jgi:hypothetical protein